MRSIWRGAINFGMVTIPCKPYTATEQKDVRFRLVHKKDGAPIVEKRFCSEEDKEGRGGDRQGYEVSKAISSSGTRRDLGRGAERSHTNASATSSSSTRSTIYFEKSYTWSPSTSASSRSTCSAAPRGNRRVAVAKVAIRTKERLATLRVYQETLCSRRCTARRDPRSVSSTCRRQGGARLERSPMARTLIENLASHFDPDQYKDEFRSTLIQLIERKVRGESRSAKRRKPDPKIVDLMEALQASLSAAQSARATTTTKATTTKATTTKPKSGSARSRTRAGGKAA